MGYIYSSKLTLISYIASDATPSVTGNNLRRYSQSHYEFNLRNRCSGSQDVMILNLNIKKQGDLDDPLSELILEINKSNNSLRF